MIVDDEEAIRDSLKQYLDSHGYRVQAFSSGYESFEAFKADPSAFDLVITDMTMPGITGDQLAAEILKIRPDLPIILCTGFSENISPAEAKALGIKRFAYKPIGGQEVTALIRKILDNAEDLPS